MNDKEFLEFLYDEIPNNHNIHKNLIVTRNKLREYKRIAASYSAGSDSDIMLDMMELAKPPDCGEIRYTFFNAGLEYDATLRHITETEQKYGIAVERIKPRKSIPAACREHGVPFICKDVSSILGRLQAHDFDWHDTAENATTDKTAAANLPFLRLTWRYCLAKNRVCLFTTKSSQATFQTCRLSSNC